MVTQVSETNDKRIIPINAFNQNIIARIALFISSFHPSIWKRRCLFSSLLIMKWAHSKGLIPKLNIGMREGLKSMEGHAWLSLDGKPFCERSTLRENYPIRFSRSRKINYWYGEEQQISKFASGDMG